MAEELNSEQIAPRQKRKYTRHKSISSQTQSIVPNQAVLEMESAMPALMNQRMQANQKVRSMQQHATMANLALEGAREELAQIENEVNYRLQTIAAMKGQQFTPPPQTFVTQPYPQRQFGDYPQPPSPMYTPSIPYPTMPPPVMDGVGSYPATNRGLYPDASDPRLNLDRDPEISANGASAEDVRRREVEGRHGSMR